jgi:hypothetical protein
MTDIRLADISEFQSNIDAPAYLGGGHRVVIIRAHNGYRPDQFMPSRRDYLRSHPFVGIGYYQFIAAVERLQDHEWPILDLEEGGGSQVARAQAWFDVVDAWCGFQAMMYSGLYFLRDQLGGAGRWGSRPLWVAAYDAREPAGTHLLWQHTDSARFPGIPGGGVDGNIARVSDEEFVRAARGGRRPAVVPPTPRDEEQRIATVVNRDGRLETFAEVAGSGEVLHAFQATPGGGWVGGEPGKRALEWYSLGTPGR